MKISIITATYNSAKTVRDTLESVKNQTYGDIEHIIVDGLSGDNTLAIVAEYPHVAKVISEKDKGIYDAMNKGVALATGDIVAILNSDDFYNDETVISLVMSKFIKTAQLDTVYGDLLYVNPDDTSKIERVWKSGTFQKSNFYYGWMPPHPSFFVKKELYHKFGVFDTSFRSAADYELMLRFLFKNNVSTDYVPYTLVKMRSGGQSNLGFRNRWRAHLEDRRAWQHNDLKPYFFTLLLKPISKIKQYFIK